MAQPHFLILNRHRSNFEDEKQARFMFARCKQPLAVVQNRHVLSRRPKKREGPPASDLTPAYSGGRGGP